MAAEEDTDTITNRSNLIETIEASILGLAIGGAVLLNSFDFTTLWQSVAIASIPSAFGMIHSSKKLELGRLGRTFFCLWFGAVAGILVTLIIWFVPTSIQSVSAAIFTMSGALMGVGAFVQFIKLHRTQDAS